MISDLLVPLIHRVMSSTIEHHEYGNSMFGHEAPNGLGDANALQIRGFSKISQAIFCRIFGRLDDQDIPDPLDLRIQYVLELLGVHWWLSAFFVGKAINRSLG